MELQTKYKLDLQKIWSMNQNKLYENIIKAILSARPLIPKNSIDTRMEIENEVEKVFLESKNIKLAIWEAFKLGQMSEQERKRTPKQNNSIHLYLELLAKSCNEAGITLPEVLSAALEIDCTKDNLKEGLWRPIQVKLYNKKSTTKLLKNRGEIDNIWEHINRYLAENPKTCGIENPPFPHEEPGIEVPDYEYKEIPF